MTIQTRQRPDHQGITNGKQFDKLKAIQENERTHDVYGYKINS